MKTEDGIRSCHVTGVQTCALPIPTRLRASSSAAPARCSPTCGTAPPMTTPASAWWSTRAPPTPTSPPGACTTCCSTAPCPTSPRPILRCPVSDRSCEAVAQGLIRRADVDQVRERSRLDEIVAEHVTLRTAGIGSMKGLCPFHDEQTPSFHIRPQLGHWHCFGCGEGGDVVAFAHQIDHLGFVEAVELVAGRYGIELHDEDGGRGGGRPGFGTRRRLLDAHAIAEEYYREQLSSPGAEVGRRFLTERGFDRAAAEHFGVGFAPEGWDAITRVLRGRGFTEPELIASGLVSQGQRGVYDRFRGRLVWPIRDITGNTIGFGARRLLESDPGDRKSAV